MDLGEWKKLRAKWVKARDSATPKVEKGAVKGVSIGDSIDAVAKAIVRGPLPLSRELTKLRQNVNKYKAGIKARNPKLADWLEANVGKPADELDDLVGDDVARLDSIRREMQLFKSRTDLYFPEGEEFHKIGIKAKKDGVPWQKASKPLFDQLDKSLLGWRGISRAVSACAREMQLPLGVKPSKAELERLADYFEHEIRLVGALPGCATLEDFQYKAKGCRDSFYILCTAAGETSKAIDKLMP